MFNGRYQVPILSVYMCPHCIAYQFPQIYLVPLIGKSITHTSSAATGIISVPSHPLCNIVPLTDWTCTPYQWRPGWGGGGGGGGQGGHQPTCRFMTWGAMGTEGCQAGPGCRCYSTSPSRQCTCMYYPALALNRLI